MSKSVFCIGTLVFTVTSAPPADAHHSYVEIEGTLVAALWQNPHQRRQAGNEVQGSSTMRVVAPGPTPPDSAWA